MHTLYLTISKNLFRTSRKNAYQYQPVQYNGDSTILEIWNNS